jgi:hypothetical protein
MARRVTKTTAKGVVKKPAPTKRAARAAATESRRPSPRRELTGSVIVQARIDRGFASEVLGRDATVLGLDGPSEVVREGLRLVHQRAQEQALIEAYDAFYRGGKAPLPTGVVAPEKD